MSFLKRFVLTCTLLLLGTQSVFAQVAAKPDPTKDGNYGWLGEKEAEKTRIALVGTPQEVVELHLVGADRADTSNKIVVLWHAMKRMELKDSAGNVIKKRGEHFPNVPQEVGDCVGAGNSHAVDYSLATSLILGGEGKFRECFRSYVYGISRVQIGGSGGGGDGSCGVWAAKALEQYGVLPADAPGVPKYSGSVSRKWGARPGPPQDLIDIAKPFTCQTRMVTDWDGACQALSNGWAIAVCSNAGYGKIVEANGRIEGRWTTSWGHCMCLCGFDSRPGREAVYCLNSWGPNAHAKASRYAELDGAPPGGFWILRADVERMLKARDSYAISFNGFSPKKSTYEKLMNPGAN